MAKEYGKLTADQFRELIGVIPELVGMIRGMTEHLSTMPIAKFDSVMPGDYGFYSRVY